LTSGRAGGEAAGFPLGRGFAPAPLAGLCLLSSLKQRERRKRKLRGQAMESECFWTGPRPETRIFQASGGFAEPGLKNSCFWTGHRPKTRFSSSRPKHVAAFLFLLQTVSDKNNNKL